MADDTIFALSTGAPPAAIAVVRISGPDASAALTGLAGKLPAPRHAARRQLRDAAGELLDDALVLWFPGPATATGEDLAELHLHGGRAVIAAVMAALTARDGLRPAEAGEFTRRALLNGRIDLTQAEGLAELLAAESEAQRRAALAAAEGGVGREVAGWLVQITQVAAMIEADLDYGDEVETDAWPNIAQRIAAVGAEIADVLSRPSVERLREGVRIVLAGPPNAGKSSLLNALVEREVAIVSPIAGTTRDVVEATVIRNGRVFVLADTAGLAMETTDPIERIGIARAHERIAASDLLLWLGDAAPPRSGLALYPRADDRPADEQSNRLPVSIAWPASIENLWTAIEDRTAQVSGEHQHLYNARQREHIETTMVALDTARCCQEPLLAAEHIRHARQALNRLLGYDDIETILDALFSRFCVGK